MLVAKVFFVLFIHNRDNLRHELRATHWGNCIAFFIWLLLLASVCDFHEIIYNQASVPPSYNYVVKTGILFVWTYNLKIIYASGEGGIRLFCVSGYPTYPNVYWRTRPVYKWRDAEKDVFRSTLTLIEN